MTYTLETPVLRIHSIDSGSLISGLLLEVKTGSGWQLMAKSDPLSHVIYKDNAGNRHEMNFVAQTCGAQNDSLILRGEAQDNDGVMWRLTVRLARADDQITADYRLEVSASRQVYRWIGPNLLVGEGAFGAARDEALFPGLEYLIGDEPSSDTRFAAPKYANRTVPHAYKITVPFMAVSHAGCGVGLMWDPNQEWGGAWRHPAAMFSSPNRIDQNAQNHKMALFTPSVESRWLNDGDHEAHTPYGISPDRPSTLSARMVAAPEGGVIGILREWVATYGLPALPDAGHDYRQNIELTVESFLDVAWDEQAEGWHHTLADPWEPRYEALLANQLWRYSRWSLANPTFSARARDQVQRAIKVASRKDGAGWYYPSLDQPLVYGEVTAALDHLGELARQLMTEQQSDGSWGWTPAAVAQVADFKTEDRLAVMGKEKDSATGFTSSKVIPLLRYALATGNPEAVAAVKHAADWCNTQQRPEGAQTWELHLHVPDVLAVPYLINLNLAVYQFTGDEQYLDQANRWAWTGLPFTFLWNGYYRPIMRFGTIPVFGVTFHDVQSWFGVIVHWNGLWYSDALFRLAKHRRTDGVIDWYQLAEGITRHGMQEQAKDGRWKGMYPDAFSTVRGDEEYVWWLNPQLIGLNTMPLAGLPVTVEPIVVNGIHISSGAEIEQVETQNGLWVTLRDQPGQTSYTLVSGKRSTTITCDGAALTEVENVDQADEGWQWLPSHQVALVKLRFADQPRQLHCSE